MAWGVAWVFDCYLQGLGPIPSTVRKVIFQYYLGNNDKEVALYKCSLEAMLRPYHIASEASNWA